MESLTKWPAPGWYPPDQFLNTNSVRGYSRTSLRNQMSPPGLRLAVHGTSSLAAPGADSLPTGYFLAPLILGRVGRI